MNTHDRRLFRGLDSPELPEDLQRQVLWRAHAALRAPIPRPDLWGRMRTNRGLRLAWAVSAAVLCAANLALSGWMTPRPEPRAPSARTAPDPEIGAIVDLPPLRLAADGGMSSRIETRTNRPDSEDLS